MLVGDVVLFFGDGTDDPGLSIVIGIIVLVVIGGKGIDNNVVFLQDRGVVVIIRVVISTNFRDS